MENEYSFNSQQTINSDEDEKLIDVQTFPTNFFLFSETSTQSVSSLESANQPISPPKCKFMSGRYTAESQEQNNIIRTVKEQKQVQTDLNINIQTKKYSFLERQNKIITHRNQQTLNEKKNNLDRKTQRSSQEKQVYRSQQREKSSLTPRTKKLKEKKLMPNKQNGILKISCLNCSTTGNPKIQPIFDLFVGRPSNKYVSFQFTMEQIKAMRKNNKSNTIKKNIPIFDQSLKQYQIILNIFLLYIQYAY